MKRDSFYILLLGVVCVYITMNVGYGMHNCSKDGTSKVMLLTQEKPCSCNHHDKEPDNDDLPECCRNAGQPDEPDEPDDRCCETLIYILDTEQTVADCIQVKVPVAVWAVVPQIINNDLCVLYESTLVAFHVAGIALGPNGGLDSITPLRL